MSYILTFISWFNDDHKLGQTLVNKLHRWFVYSGGRIV